MAGKDFEGKAKAAEMDLWQRLDAVAAYLDYVPDCRPDAERRAHAQLARLAAAQARELAEIRDASAEFDRAVSLVPKGRQEPT